MTMLPQLKQPFLADAGMETDLLFNEGAEMPCFSSLPLAGDEEGRAMLRKYYRRYLRIAEEAGCGLILETPTWRASPDWAKPLGLDLEKMGRLNAEAVRLVVSLKQETDITLLVSGSIGPRGDGYDPGNIMTVREAERYHGWQARILAESGADILTAMTITNVNEAVGIVRAASANDSQCAISFTVETDGRLPTGDALGAAIEAVDQTTDGAAAYFMINCAHTSHFDDVLDSTQPWMERLKGIRANASRLSHEELDEMTELDEGDPFEFGRDYARIRARHPSITVFGGCCGSDHRHIAEVAKNCMRQPSFEVAAADS